MLENNRKKEVKFEEMKQHLDEFKQGKRSDPPVATNGKEVTRHIPPIKREHEVLQCHCFQMHCTQENSDVGTT